MPRKSPKNRRPEITPGEQKKLNEERLWEKLRDRISYIELMTLMLKQKPDKFKERLGLIQRIQEFLTYTSDSIKTDRILEYLKEIQSDIESLQIFCPPKESIEIIGEKWIRYRQVLEKKENSFDVNGVEFGWVESLVTLPYSENDFSAPYHSRVGIGRNAGRLFVEEMQLLRDAFLYFALAERSFKKIKEFYTTKNGQLYTDANREIDSIMKENISSACRIAIITFFNFVEVFVNSIGNDFLKRNGDKLEVKQKNILRGFDQKGKYIGLDYKMEHYSNIIRGKEDWLIILKDEKQRKEPFLTFFTKIKEWRDSYIHYSPDKVTFFKKNDEFLNDVRITSEISIQTASSFWKVCYPSRKLPGYLENLDYDKCIEKGRKEVNYI